MKLRRGLWPILLLVMIHCLCISAYGQKRRPDVHYEPTRQEIVEEMLDMAAVTQEDVVYDLGCGDGRFVITAAKRYGARGIGIDIDPVRIKEATENAYRAGVTDRVRFIEKDLFETDIREATVVALYLLPELNLRLRPKLFRELRPGARIVSNTFDMGEWKPDKVSAVLAKSFYYWVIPSDVRGRWVWSISSPMGREHYTMLLHQTFQEIRGKVTIQDKKVSISDKRLIGNQLSFRVKRRSQGQTAVMRFTGHVDGDTIRGTLHVEGGVISGQQKWVAKRVP